VALICSITPERISIGALGPVGAQATKPKATMKVNATFEICLNMMITLKFVYLCKAVKVKCNS
jgi:hypothetical protein